jgi:serine protease Do
VVLADVRPGGPAALAGLRPGDVVVALDDKPMENARQFEVNLYARPVGQLVTLEVARGPDRVPVRVEVVDRVDDPDGLVARVEPETNIVAPLGILGLDLDEALLKALPSLRARAGVVVAAAAPDSPAWRDPLRAGDVIYTLNQQPVMSLARLRELLTALRPGDPIVLHVERSGELRYIALELE